MKFGAPMYTMAAACIALVVAGCGSSISTPPKPPTPTAQARPTTIPISASLASFGQYTDPLLQESISMAQSALIDMKSPDFATLGDQCTLVGGQLASEMTTLRTARGPQAADPVYRTAVNGLKVAQSATDECATAADAASKQGLKTATKDLTWAIKQMRWAESSTARWQGAASQS